jgi:hypothetical protein
VAMRTFSYVLAGKECIPGHFLFVVFICVLALTSCKIRDNAKQTQKFKVITIHPHESRSVGLTDLFQEVSLIPLQTSPDALLGSIVRMEIHNNLFFIMDGQLVTIFNTDGTFVSKVSHQGEDPWQYQEFSDFFVDTVQHVIEIMDGVGRRFQRYDFLGTWLSSSTFPWTAWKYARQGKQYLFFCGNLNNPGHNYSLIITDSISGYPFVRGYFPIADYAKKFLHMSGSYHFYSFAGNLHFFKPLTDTVYQLHEPGVVPRYVVDFGRHRIDAEKLFSREYADMMEFFRFLKSQDYAFNLHNVLENETFLFFRYQIGQESRHVYYDKRTDSVFNIHAWKSDWFDGKSIRVSAGNAPKAVDGKHFYYNMDAYELIATLDSIRSAMPAVQLQEYIRKHSDLATVYEQLKPDDNPIIIRCRIKK